MQFYRQYYHKERLQKYIIYLIWCIKIFIKEFGAEQQYTYPVVCKLFYTNFFRLKYEFLYE